MYKLFLTTRYLFRKLIAVFAMISVWLCVAMVLIVFSVMDGFLENIKQHSRGLLSDIIIDTATLQGFPYYDEFGKYLLETEPETVKVTTPVIYNYSIMRVRDWNNYTKPVRVVGIDLEGYSSVNTFHDSLYYEKYYPGTTTLGEMAVPIAGIGSDEKAILPPKYEEAFAKYKAEHADDEDLQNLEVSISSPHGIGRFEQYFEQPGYAGDMRPGVIVGTDVLYRTKPDGSYDRVLNRGSDIILTLLPLTVRGTFAEDPVPVLTRFADDSRTRVYDIDSMCVYVDFNLLQKLLSMGALELADGGFTPPRASQLLVNLKEGTDYTAARQRIERRWDEYCLNLAFDIPTAEIQKLTPGQLVGLWERLRMGGSAKLTGEDAVLLAGVGIETWEERQKAYISAVEKEKVLVTILFLIISLVAVVLIGVIFHMIVLQKIRDIGIIKSLGATRWGVASVFIMYGASVGLIGGLLGVITGTIFVHHINEVQDWLASFDPSLRVWSPEVYTFDRIPSVVRPEVSFIIFGMSVLISTLGALIPALRAAWVWPVDTLRYE